VLEGLTCRLLRPPASHPLGGGVDVGHSAREVRADHRVTNRIERGYSALLFVEERLFCRPVAEERSKRARQGTDETRPDFEEAIVVFHVHLEPGSLDSHRPTSRGLF
jgi:hypothetical protein